MQVLPRARPAFFGMLDVRRDRGSPSFLIVISLGRRPSTKAFHRPEPL